MFFSCQNAKKKDFIIEIDGKRVFCQESPSGIFANIELEKGKHILSVRKRTCYDTPLWYLNIINPLYVIWQLKFMYSSKLGYDEKFSAIEISFKCNGDNTERIELDFEKIVSDYLNGEYYKLCCERYAGIKNVVISELKMDKSKIMRCKLTRILAVLLYMIISCGLCLSSFLKGSSSGTVTLIFCLLNAWICLTVVFRAAFEKSVSENLAQAKKYKKYKKS